MKKSKGFISHENVPKTNKFDHAQVTPYITIKSSIQKDSKKSTFFILRSKVMRSEGGY